MSKGRIEKIIGKISDEIVNRYELYDYKNSDIYQSMDLYIHTIKHREEFQTIDNYNNALNNISNVIAEPRFVYYDRKRNSLLYFKNVNENICLVVKLYLKKNKKSYVATLYPISENKVLKYIEQSYINNK